MEGAVVTAADERGVQRNHGAARERRITQGCFTFQFSISLEQRQNTHRHSFFSDKCMQSRLHWFAIELESEQSVYYGGMCGWGFL